MFHGIDKGTQWGEGLTGGFGPRTAHKYWWTHRFHISIWWGSSWAWNPFPRLRKSHPGHTHTPLILSPYFGLSPGDTGMKELWKLFSSLYLLDLISLPLVPHWLQRPSEYRDMPWLWLPEIQGQAASPGCHIESYHSYQIIKVQYYSGGTVQKKICTWKSLSNANTPSLLPNV